MSAEPWPATAAPGAGLPPDLAAEVDRRNREPAPAPRLAAVRRPGGTAHDPEQDRPPTGEGEPSEGDPPPATLVDRILRRDQLADLPQPEPLIDDTLDRRTVSLLAGRNSTGKSFLALDWACCIATGKPWQGRTVHEPGAVLYVAAEGAYGLHQRVSAWEHAWHREVVDLDVLPEPVNLFTGAGFADLRRHVQARCYRLVVVDTWARSTVGGKENDNSDSTVAFERVDRLRRTGPSVLVVAHTDGADTKARGATALEDNADTVYRIKGDAGYLELDRTKRKDGPGEDRHQLQLKPVLDSCIVQNTRGQDHVLSGRAEALMSAFSEHFADMGASKAELRAVADQAPATFARSLRSLVTQGLLVNHGSDARPFYKPGKESTQ